jgi:hypothetical protein
MIYDVGKPGTCLGLELARKVVRLNKTPPPLPLSFLITGSPTAINTDTQANFRKTCTDSLPHRTTAQYQKSE